MMELVVIFSVLFYFIYPGLDEMPLPPPPAQEVLCAGQLFTLCTNRI